MKGPMRTNSGDQVISDLNFKPILEEEKSNLLQVSKKDLTPQSSLFDDEDEFDF